MSASPRVFNKRKGHPAAPQGSVYVGRPSKWGNPFPMALEAHRQYSIDRYREWLVKNPDGQKIAALARKELRGKNLVCWCAPAPCHADVLLEIANG